MSQRLQIVLPDPVATQLYELAAGADTPPSTLAGQMVRNCVALAAKDGKVRPLRPAPVVVGGKGSERAPWLEPYGGDNEWRQQMWGTAAVSAGMRALGYVADSDEAALRQAGAEVVRSLGELPALLGID